MLLPIKIVNGLSLLRPFGLVNIPDSKSKTNLTMMEVFDGMSTAMFDTGDHFTLQEQYRDCTVKCLVADYSIQDILYLPQITSSIFPQ